MESLHAFLSDVAKATVPQESGGGISLLKAFSIHVKDIISTFKIQYEKAPNNGCKSINHILTIKRTTIVLRLVRIPIVY
jgi:hypothetical protein